MTIQTGYTAGYRVQDRYQLLSRVAAGQAGEVWQADDDVLGRVVAVKLLRPAYADDPGFVDRFRVEARLAGRLSHPGVVAVYDFGEEHGPMGSPWLVMEYVPGESLAAIIAREAPFDPQRALDLVAQAADAVQAAHDEGVIHRDIKPANLLVTDNDRVMVTDFGIARATGGVSLTATGQVLGTAHYLSPEQAQGQPATPASDIYALGVVLYECLSGHRPFSGATPVEVARAKINSVPAPLPASVPVELRRLVDRLLEKDPARRPASAGNLAAEIRAFASSTTDDTTVVAVAPSTGAATAGESRAARRRAARTTSTRRRPSKITLAAVGLLAGLAAFAGISAIQATEAPPSSSDAPAPSPAATTQPVGLVDVDPAQFIGRPYEEVATTLRSLGFSVRLSDAQGSGEAGIVSGLAPSGSLAYGSTVTVEVVATSTQEADSSTAEGGADQPSEDKQDRVGNGNGKGKGRG